MIVERTIVVAAPAEATFQRVLDIPFVSACLPGAADVREDGEHFRGSFTIKVGPVKVTIDGSVRILEVDQDGRRAVLRLEGSDRRIGGDLVGEMRLGVVEDEADSSRLEVYTDLAITGKLGQFGQAVMIKKADQITEVFVEEFSRRLVEDRDLEGRAAAVTTPEPSSLDVSADSARRKPPPAVPLAGVASQRPIVEGATGTWEVADPLPGLHAMFGLLRRSRTFRLQRSVGDAGERAGLGADPLWITAEGVSAGVRGNGLGDRPYVVVIRAGTVDEAVEAWSRVTRQGLAGAVALAIEPRGPALGDLSALAIVCAELSGRTGLPMLVVGGTPWSLLPLARLVSTGVAHGVVADTGESGSRVLAGLVRMGIEEVRRAGFECPVFAGPASSGGESDYLRAAGADAVLIDGSSSSWREMAGRAAARRRKAPR